ncbi:hypothetical protein ANO11243_027340 [Dothideomycetidae sp. 11243]|nr:hypothetical protein ANO11243_027340 [fungal sp. No.11243]
MSKINYTPLPQPGGNPVLRSKPSLLNYFKTAVLIVSLALNVYLVYRQNAALIGRSDGVSSKYAGLQTNTSVTYVTHTAHDSTSRKKQDDAWAEADLHSWHGVVALDESFIAEKELPPSQPWLWDESKSMYYLAGPHQMLCLNAVREFINENQDGLTNRQQQHSYARVMHCLNTIREAIMCAADDTPLYMGKYNANADAKHPIVGVGFTAQCRDWHALMDWARERSACYMGQYVHGMENKTEMERHMFCPEGMEKPWDETKLAKMQAKTKGKSDDIGV